MPEKNITEVPKEAKEYFDKGIVSLERGNLDAAIHFFSDAVLREPAFLKARQALRQSQIKKSKSGGMFSKIGGMMTGGATLAAAMTSLKKNPEKAMDAAEKALSGNPFNLQALKMLSEAAQNMDLPQTAIFAYETAREGHPKNINVLLSLAHLYEAALMNDKACECYEQARLLDPNNSEAYAGAKNATANQALKKGKWEESGSYRDMIANLDEARSLEQAGKSFSKDEELIREQMTDIYRLTQEQPENITHWKKLGDLSLQINEFEYALQYYQHAFDLSKGADGTIENLISDVKLKKNLFSLKQKEQLLDANPEDEQLKQEVQQLKLEREKTILEEYEAKSQRYPNDLDIRFELAQVYFRNNLVDKALKEFQVASANPKTKVSCTYWLGRCFKEKGMLDMAVQRFKSAAEQAPTMDNLKKEILYNLGLTFEQMSKASEAIEQFKLIYDVDIDFRDVGKKIENYYSSQSGAPPAA